MVAFVGLMQTPRRAPWTSDNEKKAVTHVQDCGNLGRGFATKEDFMAVRYSGNVRVQCSIDEKAASRGVDQHKCVVSANGHSKTIYVGVRLVHGSGHGLDSPKMYDESASAAISFAANEGLDVEPEYDEERTGYKIYRSAPAYVKVKPRGTKKASAATRPAKKRSVVRR